MVTSVASNHNSVLAQKADEFVNQVFYGALLREFRQAQRPTIFDQGPGANTFIRQLDMELIKRMSSSGGSPLARMLCDHLDSRAGVHLTGARADGAASSAGEITHG